MADPVLVTRDGAVTTIQLNRADSMNSLTVDAKVALREACKEVASDRSVRAVVLTGSGRAFCAGQDLREHAEQLESGSPSPLSTVEEHFNPITISLATMAKPVIAAINGTAAGAGLGLALACDFRVAVEGARFTTAFAGIGLTADSGLSWSLPRAVGTARATALLLLSEPFTAEQALEMGMINAVVAAERFDDTVRELAARLAAGPTAAYAAIKESVAFSASADLPAALAREAELQVAVGSTSDHANAVRSFVAKERPAFTGQ